MTGSMSLIRRRVSCAFSRFITCCADEDIPPRLFEPYILIPLGDLQSRLDEILNEDFPVQASDFKEAVR